MINITVSEVQWPSEGKKTGVITDSTGKRWGAWPEVLNNVQAGQAYMVEYTVRNWQGKTYHNITKILPMGAAPQAVNTPNRAPAPAMSPARPMNTVSDNERRMDIFICGAFNNFMSNPNVNPTELTMLQMIDYIHKLKDAWNGVFGPSPIPRPAPQRQQPDPISTGLSPQNNQDLDDSIPF